MIIDDFLTAHTPDYERKALEALRCPETYPGLPALARSDIILRLYRFEGLGRYWVWAVAARGTIFCVRRLVWDRPADYHPGIIEPTLLGSEGRMLAEAIEQLMAALCSITLRPFVARRVAGLDGVNFGVEYGNFWQAAGLYWWGTSSLSEGWGLLDEWFTGATAAFDACLPSQGYTCEGRGA